ADGGAGVMGGDRATGPFRTPARVRWLAAGGAFAVHAAAVLAAIAGVWEETPPAPHPVPALVTFSVPASAPLAPPTPPPARANDETRERPHLAARPPVTAPAPEAVVPAQPVAAPARPAVALPQRLPLPVKVEVVPASPSVQDPLAAYKGALWQQIMSRRPRGVQGEGSVLLSFRLDRTGALLSADVARSCGNMNLDRLALRALRGAAPFPAPPAGVADAQLVFTLPMNFR
ncbi:MAG: energy transducer TonB, partial [Novosphingobium sp.]|nr:energy transducer TonB [Novosphingobium sp.]